MSDENDINLPTVGPRWYVLINREAVSVDMITWGRWLEANPQNRVVRQENVGGFMVSTVFLGLDHNHMRNGPPILFETMVFNRKPDGKVDFEDLYANRCSTYDEAEQMHVEACDYIRAKLLS